MPRYGFIMCYFLFGIRILFAICTALIAYPVLQFDPKYVTILAWIMNSITHIYHLINVSAGWSMEITGTCIVIFEKIVSTPFNLYDGRRLKNKEDIKRPHLIKFALTEKPSLFEWLSYCLTPFGGSTGPFFEFKYFDLMVTDHERAHIKSDSESRKLALFKYFGSFGWAVATVIGFKYCKLSTYYDPNYLNKPLIVRLALMILITSFQAIKYFSAWWLVEASLYEFGFLESDLVDSKESPSFTNESFLYVIKSETCGQWMQRWNHSTHIFGKNYLFFRLLDAKYSYTLAFSAVFVCSALWHGFRPVYYMILPELLIAISADKRLNKILPNSDNFLVVFLKRCWVVFTMLSATATWWSSTAQAFFYVRKTVNFAPQIFELIVLIILYLIPVKTEKKEKKE
ncbi:MBOAT family protein [Trichomonas vaginalis G3]|uniref:MBOAT family protein n=1 Tax=Trichomonas vaginalis (strain ATCC PRA-98 / G3) TaxID=412133 RepID=A2FCU8_TRIV3|nr:1-acylglycerophosphocholine O-acyltransferase protein [Trichomonas vaginalis G3]EAX97279.1 MBOAT family protein [Trichomonas vaginalis G3]KAI5550757.1 1-acylglycerophosphocholine O-acyltransferase protein [Trichomonas vaginalis G3]|eukprot:XP_001310209.1 MBOAT family protein [Trichomonas vaginalis G3]